TREKPDVDKSPRQPRREPAQLDKAGIQNGAAAPDHGHVAFVKIAERWWHGTPGLAMRDHFAHETSLLHGHLRDPGQRLAILIERGRVADDEDLWIARHTAIWLHAYASGPVGRRLQPGARWRRRDASGPDDGAARNAFVPNDDVRLVNRFHGLSGAHLHSYALQARLGFARKFFGKGREDAGRGFRQNDARLLR